MKRVNGGIEVKVRDRVVPAVSGEETTKERTEEMKAGQVREARAKKGAAVSQGYVGLADSEMAKLRNVKLCKICSAVDLAGRDMSGYVACFIMLPEEAAKFDPAWCVPGVR